MVAGTISRRLRGPHRLRSATTGGARDEARRYRLPVGRQQHPQGAEVHRILLRAGVVILEGLDLSKTEPGEYELVCLPLQLMGADAAPARAVLRRKAFGSAT